MSATVRSDWTIPEITAVYEQPLMALVRTASDVHRAFHDPDEVQVNQLLSIKTGACPEDCGYCSQSVHYDTGVKPEPLMDVDEVVRTAKRAKRAGVTRFCMGAAWREVKDNAEFDRVCEIVSQVNDLGMEVYVKVCDAYGAGFFDIPGTDTCLKMGGYLRADHTYGDGGNQGAYYLSNANARHDRFDTDAYGFRARLNLP